MEINGITDKLGEMVQNAGEINAFNLSVLTTILSNIVSNVPAVLLLKPIITQMTNQTAGWLTLAASSTLAGNLTLLGSVANLIVAESAKRRRVNISFWEYTKIGVIITFITLLLSIAWISIFIWK